MKTVSLTSFVLSALLLASPAAPQEPQDDLKAQAVKMKDQVKKLRGLDFKKEVAVGVYSKDELKKFIEKEFEDEVPVARAKRFEKAYVHFRLIPEGLDLRQAYIDLMTDSIAGFYHPKTKELKLVGGESNEEKDALKALGINQDEITLVHELTHAAQDQHFDLYTVPMEEERNDDLVAAIKGLVEGEASVVGWKHGLKGTFDFAIGQINEGYKTGMLPGKAGELPAYLRLTLCFPYGYGTDFVLAVLKGNKKDWNVISKMYEDLPSSTEQVLHPKKYYKDRDNPVEITLPDLGAGDVLENNVHGEFVIRILLQELDPDSTEKDRNDAAAGWGGDRYEVFEKDGKVSSVWYTTWDTEKDAEEFFAAYDKALGNKYKDWTDSKATATRVRRGNGKGRGVTIDRKGSDVLVLDGDAKLSDRLEEIYEKTHKEEFKTVERFKLGHWTCPHHPTVDHDLNSYCSECGSRLVAKKKRRDYR